MENQELSGNNVMSVEDRNAQLAALKADVEQTQAQLAQAAQDPTPQATADTATQEQTPSTPAPEAKAPEGKKDSLQQFRDKSGEVSEEKIQKGIEHLRQGIEDKEARREALLKEYKDLQRKHTQVSQEVRQVESQAKAQAPANPLDQLATGNLSPEFKMQIAKDLETDPIGTLLKLNRAVAQYEADQRLNSIRPDLDGLREQSMDVVRRRELDSLIDSGHGWILSEGLGRFDRVFQERPYLLQSKTPYKDALLFMPDAPAANGTASHSAQVGPKTPILSASGAVPPPSSVPAVSAETQYNALSAEYDREIQRGNIAKAKEILGKMGQIVGAR